MKHIAKLKPESPFYVIFDSGEAPIKPILRVAKVKLEGSDETDVYFLDWSRCTLAQRIEISQRIAKAFKTDAKTFADWMNRGGALPIRVSQTESATLGADMRSFL
jgi:hypothetical protein